MFNFVFFSIRWVNHQIWYFYFFKYFLCSLGDRPCSSLDLVDPKCSSSEVCDETTNTCQCPPGHERAGPTVCIAIKTDVSTTPSYSSLIEDQSSGSVVIGVLIPVILIGFVMFGVYLSRKYRLVAWIRGKINHRNENYDEFMIGQDLDDDDDPPLRWRTFN